MHSSGVGAAAARDTTGQDVAIIMSCVGWKSKTIANLYMETAVSQGMPWATSLEEVEEAYIDAHELGHQCPTEFVFRG